MVDGRVAEVFGLLLVFGEPGMTGCKTVAVRSIRRLDAYLQGLVHAHLSIDHHCINVLIREIV